MTASLEFIESGVPGLDHVLRGGLPKDRMVAVVGTSGSGKTTFSLQFLLHGKQKGERCLYIGTSETDEELHRIAASHGWSLEGIEIRRPPLGGENKPGPEQTMLHPAEVELPRTVEMLMQAIEEINPRRVVVDSLSELRLLARQETWYQRQLLMLKQFLLSRRITALFTDTLQSHNSVLATIVHGVIDLSRTDPLFGPERRRLSVVKLRGQSYISGYHDYRIATGGVQVFPRLIAAEHTHDFISQNRSSGLPELDALLGGGLDRGTCTLLQGSAGTGKSALVTQFAAAAAARGEKSLIFCFDERIQTFVQRARGLSVPIDQHMKNKTITVKQVDPAELSAGEFSSMVAEAVNRDEVTMVGIDSLNGYAHALPEERFLSVHLHELASFLNLQGVISLFTLAVHGGPMPLQAPFEISYVADTVISLRYFEYQAAVHKSISVQKRRAGGHESTIRELTMDNNGVHVGPVLQKFEGVFTGNPRYLGDRVNEGNTDS